MWFGSRAPKCGVAQGDLRQAYVPWSPPDASVPDLSLHRLCLNFWSQYQYVTSLIARTHLKRGGQFKALPLTLGCPCAGVEKYVDIATAKVVTRVLTGQAPHGAVPENWAGPDNQWCPAQSWVHSEEVHGLGSTSAGMVSDVHFHSPRLLRFILMVAPDNAEAMLLSLNVAWI